jgi:hypothetical protein
MGLVLADRVKERSRSAGTGDFTLDGNIDGFRTFAAVGDGNETYYGITDAAGNWEIGRGTYTSATTTLSRDSILSSSNSNLHVDFPRGAKNVFCTFPAEAAAAFVYNLSAENANDGAIIRLAFSEGSTDDVNIVGAGGTTVTRPDANTIKIDTNIAQGVMMVFGM